MVALGNNTFEGGEAASSQNIYGNGFYTTDDLIK